MHDPPFAYVDEDKIISHLVCAVCQQPFIDPHKPACKKHTFCFSCVKTLPACPTCRHPINGVEELKPAEDHMLVILLNELVVYCSFRERGCSWDRAKIWKSTRNGVAGFIFAVGVHAVVIRRRARKSSRSTKSTASLATHNALRAASLLVSGVSLRTTSTKTAQLSNKGDERRNCVKTNASKRLVYLRGCFYG